jgi:hypothetical protein
VVESVQVGVIFYGSAAAILGAIVGVILLRSATTVLRLSKSAVSQTEAS